MKQYPDYTAYGYVITINGKDYCITLEGVEKQTGFYSERESEEFYKLFGNADELIVDDDNIYCWYD